MFDSYPFVARFFVVVVVCFRYIVMQICFECLIQIDKCCVHAVYSQLFARCTIDLIVLMYFVYVLFVSPFSPPFVPLCDERDILSM